MRDLRAQLLEAEAAHFSKTNPAVAKSSEPTISSKRQLENGPGPDGEEDIEAKRRRILEETRDVDADSDGSKSDDSSEEDRYDKEASGGRHLLTKGFQTVTMKTKQPSCCGS